MPQTNTAAPSGRGGLRVRTAAIVFSLLAVVQTWPMLRVAGSEVTRWGDGLLNAWLLTAVVQQVASHPLSPFDVNMYYPYASALATLDHQLSALPITAPVWFATGNPLLVVNLFTIATFALAGFWTAMLVAWLSGSAGGALVAGSVYAFAAMRFEDLGHTHMLGNCWLPLSLLTVHRYVRRPTWRRMWEMTGAFLVLALASWYLAVIGAIAAAIVGLAAIVSERPPLRRTIGRALAGLAVIAIALGSVARVYVAVAQDYAPRLPRAFSPATDVNRQDPGTIDRTADAGVVHALSAPVESYLAARPDSRMPWLAPFAIDSLPTGLRFFPGTLASLLALVGLAGVIRTERGSRAILCTYLALGAAGMLLSFGPEVRAFGATLGPGIYPAGWPPFDLLRMPARFSVLVLMATAVLAGFGYRILRDALARPRLRQALLVAALAGVNVELAAAPLAMRPVGRVPQAYLWLKRAPPGPVVEFPVHGNFEALYWSLDSRQPTANGYGLVEPADFRRLEEFDYLSPAMLAHLRAYAQPRYLVINNEKFDALGDEHTAVLAKNLAAAADQLRLVAHFGIRDVYEVTGPSRGRIVLRSFRPWMLAGAHGISVRAHLDGRPPRGTPLLRVWGNGELLASQPADEVDERGAVDAPLPAEVSGGLNVDVTADYRLPVSAAAPVGDTGRSMRADVHLSVTPARTRLEVNGHVWIGEKGYTVVAVHPDGRVDRARAFNTSWSEDDSRALAEYLRSLPSNTAIAVASAFDASRSLTAGAVEALSTFGVAGDLRGRLGWAHAAIGVKGAPPGTALESIGDSTADCRIGSPVAVGVVVEDVRVR